MGTLPGSDTRLRIVPAPGSRLEELLDQLETAKAAVKAAEERRDAIISASKAESARAAAAIMAAQAGPGAQLPAVIDIAGSPHRAPLVMKWITPRRFSSKRFKADHPDTYEAYREWGNPYWDLRAADSNPGS